MTRCLRRAEAIWLLRRAVAVESGGLDRAQTRELYLEGGLFRFGCASAVQSSVRTATILFADIRGFTRASEGPVSEGELARELYEIFDPAALIVRRFGGTVDAYLGDGFMATFPGVARHAESALAAVRTAVTLQQVLGSLRRQGRTTFRMGISLHCGRVSVARFLRDEREVQTTYIGRQVNVAGRLSASAGDPAAVAAAPGARRVGRRRRGRGGEPRQPGDRRQRRPARGAAAARRRRGVPRGRRGGDALVRPGAVPLAPLRLRGRGALPRPRSHGARLQPGRGRSRGARDGDRGVAKGRERERAAFPPQRRGRLSRADQRRQVDAPQPAARRRSSRSSRRSRRRPAGGCAGSSTRPEGQAVIVDTPGLHAAEKAINRSLLREARAGLGGADAVLAVTDPDAPRHPAEEALLRDLVREARLPAVLAVNKVDLLDAAAARRFVEAERAARRLGPGGRASRRKTGRNVQELLGALLAALPAGEPLHPEDILSDQPEREFFAEIVREQVFHVLHQELPYSTAVVIEDVAEELEPRRRYRIRATIYVERDSQKGIIIGDGGGTLRRIGEGARRAIEELTGAPVYLGLWVKVRRNWTKDERALREFGFERG